MVAPLKGMLDVINILLVDDEPRNLDNDVAAIVLDIKMPGVSGFELAKLIKGTKRFREIPILFLTAYLLEDQDVLAGYGAGAVDYLTKPLNPQILRLKIGVFADLFR